MSVLNARGVSIIENALRLAGDSVRPIYTKEDARLASAWMGDRALLLVNWEDEVRTLTLEGLSRPITAEKPYTLENGVLTVTLLPHESFAGMLTSED